MNSCLILIECSSISDGFLIDVWINALILIHFDYLKRCAQSARPWIKAVKEVKEVKTNKTKKLKKTLVQIWHNMAPKWSQNGTKMVPKRLQNAVPKGVQETTPKIRIFSALFYSVLCG